MNNKEYLATASREELLAYIDEMQKIVASTTTLDEFVGQYPTLEAFLGSSEEKLKALIDAYQHKFSYLVACYYLQDGPNKMSSMKIFMDSAKEFLEIGAPLVESGSPTAMLNWMFNFAEERCGHNPFSARHAMSTIEDYIDTLEAELDQYHFEEQGEDTDV